MAEQKNKGDILVATNRRAFHDYHVLEQYEAGLVLVGTEVKSLRQGHCQLQGSYGRLDEKKQELWVYSINIPEYKSAGVFYQHEPQRRRKLLLHKRELRKVEKTLNEQGITLIPLKLYFKRGHAKLLIGVCRGKRMHDKRQAKKSAEAKRKIARYVQR